MGLLYHQSQQLLFRTRLPAERGTEAGRAVAQTDWELHRQLDAGGGQVSPVEYQGLHIRRIPERKEQGNIGPVGEAQEDGPGNPLFIQKGFQILGELLQGEGGVPPRALPMPPGVHRDDPVAF